MREATVLTDARFKEDLPQNTVHRIRNLLYKAGVFTVESWTDSGVNGCYSVRIEIAGTGIGQNGKGITREFALASGYAELMERIQSDYIYVGEMDEELKHYLGFLYSPSEKEFTVEEYRELYGKELEPVCRRLAEAKSKKAIAVETLLNGLRYGETLDPAKDFAALPFVELQTDCSGRSEDTVYFPVPLLRDVYATNGTCAGNSRMEAIVQGLSEILERNHSLSVLTEQLTPPDIPDTYLQRFPAWSMVQDIRGREDCALLVKDCSFGTGFPVIASILISRKSHRYAVRFGAHPVFEIALERTLTEMLQGRAIEEAAGTSTLAFSTEETNLSDNVHNVLKDGTGSFHTGLFAESKECFQEFPDRTGMTIEALYHYCLGLFEKWGYRVWIRECGFLGFPSYQILVPGFSEIYYKAGMARLREKAAQAKAGKILRDLEHADERQLGSLFLYLRYKENFSLENTLSFTLRQPAAVSAKQDTRDFFYVRLCLAARLRKWRELADCAGLLAAWDGAAVCGTDAEIYRAVQDVARSMMAEPEDSESTLEASLSVADLFYQMDVMKRVREIFNWTLCAKKISEYCKGQSFMGNEAYRIFRDVKYRLKKCNADWKQSA